MYVIIDPAKGPRNLVVNGRPSSYREALKERDKLRRMYPGEVIQIMTK